MRTVPRHRFVPAELADEAYDDCPLPIGHEQTISQPYVVALMAMVGGVAAGKRVLDVGTGSGYQAAVLAEIGAEVWTIERIAALAHRAEATLADLGLSDRVHLRIGDGKDGWPEAAPFDAILVAAATPHIPDALLAQLDPVHGRLVVPVGDAAHQELVVIEPTPWGDLKRRRITRVLFVPLV